MTAVQEPSDAARRFADAAALADPEKITAPLKRLAPIGDSQEMQVAETDRRGSFFALWPLWAGLLLFLTIGIRWLWLYRAGQPLDIDEAGYLSMSFFDYHELIHNGLAGYLSAVEASRVQAPLTSALAALVYRVTEPDWIFGFAVPLFAGVGIIAATYALGRAVGSRYVATISALLVGSCPIIINYSRSFHFALPATFMATLALVALLKSDRCRKFGWASLFGLYLGLTPLARTMTLGFVPGIGLGAVVYVVSDRDERKRRMTILGCSFLLAALVTGIWLFPNRNDVLGYLLNFGYGAHAAEYGSPKSMLSWDVWRTQAQVFLAYVYLPHALFGFIGALALLCLLAQRIVMKGLAGAASAFTSIVTPLTIFVAESIVSLTSTQNIGSAFMAPFVPAFFVLGVWACDESFGRAGYRYLITTLAALVALSGTIPSIDQKVSRLLTVSIPVLGPSIVMDGRGTIQRYEADGGFRSDNPAEPINRTEGYAWVNVSRLTSTKLAQLGAARTSTAFGFRHYMYNPNTVLLEQWVGQRGSTPFVMVDPIATGETIAGDMEWLTRGEAGRACLLLTAEGDKAQFRPAVNQTAMVQAAKQAGFETIDGWPLPDGQTVTLWRRNSQELHCAEIAEN